MRKVRKMSGEIAPKREFTQEERNAADRALARFFRDYARIGEMKIEEITRKIGLQISRGAHRILEDDGDFTIEVTDVLRELYESKKYIFNRIAHAMLDKFLAHPYAYAYDKFLFAEIFMRSIDVKSDILAYLVFTSEISEDLLSAIFPRISSRDLYRNSISFPYIIYRNRTVWRFICNKTPEIIANQDLLVAMLCASKKKGIAFIRFLQSEFPEIAGILQTQQFQDTFLKKMILERKGLAVVKVLGACGISLNILLQSLAEIEKHITFFNDEPNGLQELLAAGVQMSLTFAYCVIVNNETTPRVAEIVCEYLRARKISMMFLIDEHSKISALHCLCQDLSDDLVAGHIYMVKRKIKICEILLENGAKIFQQSSINFSAIFILRRAWHKMMKREKKDEEMKNDETHKKCMKYLARMFSLFARTVMLPLSCAQHPRLGAKSPVYAIDAHCCSFIAKLLLDDLRYCECD